MPVGLLAGFADAFVVAIDRIAVPVLNPVDQRGRYPATAIGDGRIGRRQAHDRRFPCPQSHGKNVRHVVVNAEQARIFLDHRHAQIARQPHGHHVARKLDAAPQRLWTIELSRVVFRLPDRAIGIDHFERRVEDHAGRCVAVVQCRRINDRLERRSRLAHGLRGAIEFAFSERKATNERQDAPGPWVHGNDGAFDIGYLPQGIDALFAGHRLDINHIANAQQLAQRLAHPRNGRAGQRTRDPFRTHAPINVDHRPQPDLRRIGLHVQNHGQRPLGHVSKRRNPGQRPAPVLTDLDGALDGVKTPPLVEIDQAIH